jgi:multisubunit Na+/H+ antiporter MnhB subunit
MNRTLLKAGTAALVLFVLGFALFGPAGITVVFHEEVVDFADMARRLNIRNLVSTIYLGPRLFDTFLEVMEVVLAVFGMKFIREES